MRHVDRLVLFAGPPGSGKSTTITNLQAGNLPLLSERLGIGNPFLWKCIEARNLYKVRKLQVERVIFHYDFLWQWKRELFHQGYKEDGALRILDMSDEITFVTLWATPETLIRRLQLWRVSLRKFFLKPLNFHTALQRRRRFRVIRIVQRARIVHRLYLDIPELLLQYDKWFKFCGMSGAKAHWIMDTTENVPRLAHISKWPDVQCGLRK